MVNGIVSSEILVVQWQLSTQYFINYADIRIKKIAHWQKWYFSVCVVIIYIVMILFKLYLQTKFKYKTDTIFL